MKYYSLILGVVLCAPAIVYADVHITEIAWMGTSASQYSEWFELYNDGDESVNLAGWKLVQSDGSTIFTMSKSIGAGEYLLVERTTASAPDAVPDINDESGTFGASGFANTGEDLVLKDAQGLTVETLLFASGWPAGDATSKQTMQSDGSAWVTAPATPKAPFSGSATSTTSTTPQSEKEKDPYPIPLVSPNTPHIEFVVPKPVYVGVPYEYQARPVFEYNYKVNEGLFSWNMGDGTVYRQHVYGPLMHTYQYPGTYTISFLYQDPTGENLDLKGTQKVVVTTPTIVLSIKDARAVELKNSSTTAVDLSGWALVVSGARIDIPEMTVLAERSTIVIPLSGFGVSRATHATLIDPSGAVAATTDKVSLATTNESKNIPQEHVSDVLPVDDSPAVAYAQDTASEIPIRTHTKVIVFGVVALFVIGLSILLERFMAQQEYQEKQMSQDQG